MNINNQMQKLERDMKSMKALNDVLIKKDVVTVKELEDELSGKP